MGGKNKLKEALDRLYEDSDLMARTSHDPISLPMRYRKKADREVAGFIASALAYGRVGLFLPVAGEILDRLGSAPAKALMDASARDLSGAARGLSYRFQTSPDLTGLLRALARTLKRSGSLEAAFMAGFSLEHENTGPGLSAFMRGLLEQATGTSGTTGNNQATQGLRHLFASPASGGAAKRGCLYLRWMVRDTDIDLGLWRGVPKDRLVIPLDTHIARVGRCLGLTGRRTNGWKTALDITRALSVLEPSDPLKYDFALCHRGIAGVCGNGLCGDCELSLFSV